MDSTLVNTIRQRAEWERKREGYPEGFPALPLVPAGRYTDPHFFTLERDLVFGKSWMYVAHTSELPDPGTTLLLDQFPAPLFLIRGRDQQIHCFYNTCQHRGAPLVYAGEPPVKGWLTCKYHGWAYHLDGRLAAIPEEYNFKDVDKACINLHAVSCDTWAGMIFINLDPHALPLREYLAPIVREIDSEIGDQAPVQT
ncbi:MAG: aromatic ring-hydroxylating oxygenase subunit alpha, partial [Candidatus Binatia bacterium]